MKHPPTPNIRNNNRVVLDLGKCSYAWTGWITANGNSKRQFKPITPTINGQQFDANVYLFGSHKLLIDVAYERGMLDIWIPYTTFQLSNNHSLTYIGDKAVSMMKAWNERIFNKQKKGRK